MVVQHTTLSLLAFILKRAQKNIEHCLDKRVWETSDIYNPAMMEEFVQLFREALSKVCSGVILFLRYTSSVKLHAVRREKTISTLILLVS